MPRPLSAALALACLACTGEPARASGSGPRPEGSRGSESPRSVVRSDRPGEAAAPAPSPRVVFEVPGVGDVSVRVEIARTPAQRERGLMHRRSLESDAGMLFVYPYPRVRSFWMRNTYLPLDMIFVGGDRRVVGVVEDAEPLTDDPREVEAPSQFVVEVNAGFARAHGIFAGVPVRFEGVADVLPGAAPVEDDPEDDDPEDREEEEWVE